ncbi:odorant receptor Or1-like [Arctopsyche grandis]|uniref:odorant receptor Or1-like n=1 Tax=Arctopsyche grandis TaxID=121162 RepID=UPI00406D98DD
MDHKRVKIREALDLNLAIMTISGIWPPKCFDNTWRIHAYRAYSIMGVGFFYIVFMLTEIINMIVVFGDMEKTVEASFLLLTHFSQLLKTILVVVFNTRIRDIVERLDDPVFNRGKPEHLPMILKSMNIVKKDTRLFLTMATLTVLLWAIFPLLELNDRQLPLKAWYPFDIKETPIFQIIYLYQIISGLMNAMVNISMDTLGSGIMALTAGQLDILNYELSLLWRPNGKDSGYMLQKLKECIKYHQEIIRFVVDQEYVFGYMYLGQFLVAVIVICVSAFQLTLIPISIKFVSMIIYLMCMLMEIFLYCYHGNEISIKSVEIVNSAAKCGWYEENSKFTNTLMFLMQRARKPLQVSAGKLFSLSLSTFVSILRSSYSYFTLLQHIHNE